jgi:hypothetical protein
MLGLVFSLLSVSSIAGLAQASSTASSAYDPRLAMESAGGEDLGWFWRG